MKTDLCDGGLLTITRVRSFQFFAINSRRATKTDVLIEWNRFSEEKKKLNS